MPDDRADRPRARAAAGALFTDASYRVLLVRPTYKPGWDIPGGYMERGETPFETCRREVREELGIEPPIGRLLVVDWAPDPAEGDKVVFIFDGGMLAPADLAHIQLPPDELAECAYHSQEDAATALPPRLVGRIAGAARAQREGLTLYLEQGQEPG
jgi:8-oxo-dGTP pyrophosphatase MutT (NUDIX family)